MKGSIFLFYFLFYFGLALGDGIGPGGPWRGEVPYSIMRIIAGVIIATASRKQAIYSAPNKSINAPPFCLLS